MDIIPQKRCTKCDELLPLESFHKNRSSTDRRHGSCVECMKKARKRNKEKRVASATKISVPRRRRRATHHVKRTGIPGIRQGATLREYQQAYNALNREKRSAQMSAWAKKHPEKMKAHTNNRRVRKEGNGGSYTAQEWAALKQRYSYRCLCCEKREPEIKLTADHIVPVVRGGSGDIKNIQPLCRPCNSAKGTKTIDYRL